MDQAQVIENFCRAWASLRSVNTYTNNIYLLFSHFRVEVFLVLLQSHLDLEQQTLAQVRLARVHLAQRAQQVYLVAQQHQNQGSALTLLAQLALDQLSVALGAQTHRWEVVVFSDQQVLRTQEVGFSVDKASRALALVAR